MSPIVAFLGPLGTYSHQAALDRFGPRARYRPCPTISDVHRYEPEDTTECAEGWYALLPFENSKNGIVLETLDLLLAAERPSVSSSQRRIVQEVRVQVQHCLIVRAGRKGGLNEIEWVRSHEQALAQCQTFLSVSLPQARRLPTSSTAGAAQSLLEEGGEKGAAICSRGVVQVLDGLEVAKEGIEDMSGNTTRFLVFHATLDHPRTPPPPSSTPSSGSTLHLYRYQPLSTPTFNPPPALDQAELTSVDRRPTGDGGSYYLVCFTSSQGGSQVTDDEEGRGEWRWLGSWAEYSQR